MKTLLVLFFAIAINSSLHAQIVPDSRTIGGNISAGWYDAEREWNQSKSITANISPQFGKFINSKWLREFNTYYSFRQTKSIYPEELFPDRTFRNHSFGIGARMTRFFPITNNLFFTTTGVLSLGSYFEHQNILDDQESYQYGVGLGAGIIPGFHYFITPKWIITAHFSGLNYNFNRNTEENSNTHYLRFSLTNQYSSIGFRYILGPKTKSGKD